MPKVSLTNAAPAAEQVPSHLPQVSVVITTYKRPKYLLDAIKSALAQTLPVYEVIVVDDCSPVEVEPLVRSLSDSRIRFWRQEQNLGANAARNRGVDLAKGDWVAFLDDDDCWLPEKLARQFECMFEDPSIHAMGCVCSYRFLETGKDRFWGQSGLVSLQELKQGNPYGGTSGLVVDRKLIKKVRFDETLPCGQDWDAYVRLAQESSLYYVAEPLLLYRRGSHDSLTLKAKRMQLSDVEPRLASVKKHRAWLGSHYFRLRLADQVLAYVWQKEHPIRWIRKSIHDAGVVPTLRVLLRRVTKRFWKASGVTQ